MIYTTYFANLRNLPSTITPIAICGKSPDYYTGLQYKKLAPKYSFFSIWKETHDNEFYIKEFNTQVLSRLNPKQIVEELQSLSATNDIALVCYERPSDFCHRHLVAEWLRDNGYDCQEFIKEEQLK